MWFEPKQSRGIRKHRSRIRARESFPLQQLEKDFAVTATQVSVGAAFWWRVAEVTPAVDDLFRGAATDSKLETAIADEVCGACLLHHIEGVLIPHVDDGRANLDAARPRADGREQREGRRQLLCEVMDAKVCTIGAEFFSGDRELDRLVKNIVCGARGGVPRAPVTEGQEADLLHLRRLWFEVRSI